MDEFEFDVFLSHNSKDKPAVEALAERLTEEEGLKVFLDIWNLIPGDPWQEDLEIALDKSRTVAVFLGPSGMGGWHNEEMRNALNTRVRDRRRRVIPVLLPGTQMPEEGKIPPFLTRLTWVDFRKGLEDKDAFNRFVVGITGKSQRLKGDKQRLVQLEHPRSLGDLLTILPENNGIPHNAGPGQWFSRLRVESHVDINNCYALIYDIRHLNDINDNKGVPLRRFTSSTLSWAKSERGMFGPIHIEANNPVYLDLAWRADDPPIPKDELRVASSLDIGKRDDQYFGIRQDFIPLKPGYYQLVVRLIADGYKTPAEQIYILHWSGLGKEDDIRVAVVKEN